MDNESTSDIAKALRVFNLAPPCDMNDVRKAYHKLIKMYHPDQCPTDSYRWMMANEKLLELNSTYRVITSHPNWLLAINEVASRGSVEGKASPSRCWFCGKALERVTYNLNETLKYEISRKRTFGGYKVESMTSEISINRCRECMRAHRKEKMLNKAAFPVGFGLIMAFFSLILYTKQLANVIVGWVLVPTVLVLCCIPWLVEMLFIGMSNSLFLKGRRSYKSYVEHPESRNFFKRMKQQFG